MSTHGVPHMPYYIAGCAVTAILFTFIDFAQKITGKSVFVEVGNLVTFFGG